MRDPNRPALWRTAALAALLAAPAAFAQEETVEAVQQMEAAQVEAAVAAQAAEAQAQPPTPGQPAPGQPTPDGQPQDGKKPEEGKKDEKKKPAAKGEGRSVAVLRKDAGSDAELLDSVYDQGFSYSDAEWEDVFKDLAEDAGKSLLIDKKPDGKLSYYTRDRLTVRQAIGSVNGILYSKGFTILLNDNLMRVTELEDLPAWQLREVGVADLPGLPDMEMVRVLIPLNSIKAEDAEKQFEELVGANGTLVAMPAANRLLMADIVKNVRLVVDTLASIDKGGENLQFRKYELKHIAAVQAEATVRDMLGLDAKGASSNPMAAMMQGGGDPRQMMAMMAQMRGRSRGGAPPGQPGAPGGGGGDGDGPVTSTYDALNILMVTAEPTQLALVDRVVEEIDVPAAAGAGGSQVPTTLVYDVEPGTADGLAEALEKVLSRSPETKITATDGRRLIVFATPRDHDTVEDLITQMKTESKQFYSLQLYVLDAATAVTMIGTLYGVKEKEEDSGRSRYSRYFGYGFGGGDDDEQGNKYAPTISADEARNRLLVRGTTTQIEDIRGLLVTLGEPGAGRNIGGDSYRQIPLGGQSPEEFGDKLRTIMDRINAGRGGVPVNIEVMGENKAADAAPAIDRSRPGTAVEVEAAEAAEASPPTAARWSLPTPNLPFLLVGMLQSGNALAAPAGTPAPQNSTGQPQAGSAVPAAERKPMSIVIGEENVLITGGDETERALAENIIRSLAGGPGGAADFKHYYMQNSDAQDVVETLEQLLPRKSIFEDSDEDDVQLVADPRTNAIFVTGPAAKQRKVARYIEALDAGDAPTTDVAPQPRAVEVKYGDPTSIKLTVEDIFEEQLDDNNRRGFSFFFGGGRERDRKMTLSVDDASNTIIVSAQLELFTEVEKLIRELDDRAKDNRSVTRVIPLRNMRPETMEEILGNAFSVSVSKEERRQDQQQRGREDQRGRGDEDDRGDRDRDRDRDRGDRGDRRGRRDR